MVAALLRLPMTSPGQGVGRKARRLVVGVDAGRFPDAVVDLENYRSVLAKERAALQGLCDLFVNARAGTELKTLIFHDKPAWLTVESVPIASAFAVARYLQGPLCPADAPGR